MSSSSISSILGDLSSSCQSSLTSLLSSDFASCADILGLVNVASASGSIVTPLNTYIEDICTSDPCSQSTLNNASSTINTGCSSDISSGSLVPVALNSVVENYGDIRGLLCTQHTSNKTYCVTEVLSAAQNSTGTDFSLTTISSLITGDDYTTFLSSIPTDVYCTDCGHAISTEALKIVNNVSSSSESSVSSAISDKCGSTFVDGELPSGISTVGSTGTASSASSSSGAARGLSLSGKTVALVGTFVAAVAGAGVALA